MQKTEAAPGQAGSVRRRVAVLGAGPIGIETALYAAQLGHDVTVYEAGEVGAAVRSWGHVTMFSPWSLNTSALGRARLRLIGREPPEHGTPTGAEYAARYLEPLARDPLLEGRLRLHTRVVAVGRQGLRKGDLIGRRERSLHPFRLLIEDREGERIAHADVLFDCTGTYESPNSLGSGGMLAPGERWLGSRLVRHLPDLLGRDRARFAGRRVLLVGGGLSAATAAAALSRLCDEAPGTQAVWVVRRPASPPYPPFVADPLPERARLMLAANAVAERGRRPGASLRFLDGTSVEALHAEGHQLRVRLGSSQGAAVADELFDEVLGLCGYGPDRDLYRELQVHECYASLGPMKLAAALLGAAGGDCMAQPVPGPETLRSPEPDLFILGSKSYGRGSAFLLQLGHQQIRGAFTLLHGDPGLDLYRDAESARLQRPTALGAESARATEPARAAEAAG